METIYEICLFVAMLCILIFFSFVIWLIVSLIAKKNKKKPLIAIASCVVVFLLSMIIGVITTPETENNEFQSKTEELEQIKETEEEQQKNVKKEELEIKAEEEAREQEEKRIAEEQAKKEAQEKAILEEQKRIEAEKAEEALKFEKYGLNVKFLEYKIEDNSWGDKCLVLYFDYENNSDESCSFGYTFTVKAFADGVEIEPTYGKVNDETENSYKEIRPGAKLTVAEAYELEDIENGKIEIEVTPFNIWSDSIVWEYSFDLE